MNTEPDIKKPMTPKFAAAIFFGIYALLFSLFIKFTFQPLIQNIQVPFIPSILIVTITGILMGRYFGIMLAKENHWFKVMLIGVMMSIVAILFCSLSVLMHSYFYDQSFLNHLHRWQDFFVVYGLIAVSIVLVIGFWLIPLTGLVAIYFNKRFYPQLLEIDKLRFQSKNIDSPND